MPYIVTNSTPATHEPTEDGQLGNITMGKATRRAVAVLEDQVDPETDEVTVMGVRGVVRDIMLGCAMTATPSWPEGSNAANWEAADRIPESGGTVGPLPDGTTITVEPTTCVALSNALPIQQRVIYSPGEAPSDRVYTAEIVAAYNAAQAEA